MAIAREPGMTDAELKAANAAVNAARIANNKPAAASTTTPKATPYDTGTAFNPLYGNPLNITTPKVVGTDSTPINKISMTNSLEVKPDVTIPVKVKKTLVSVIQNSDGTVTKYYSDDSEEPGTTIAGSGGGSPLEPERTLAINTFKNTFALLAGSEEANKPYVEKLYTLISGFYKTGSTIEESLTLALYEAEVKKTIPEFTERFEGIFKLRDMLKAGVAIQVPTIAEFVKSEAELGQVMIRAGFSDLANQKFLGGILGLGKSVKEVTALINETFKSIDDAPEALKKDLQLVAPGADRTSIARALLLGKEGAAALNKQIAATSVFSAFKSQNLNIDMSTAGDYAARGYDYAETLKSAGEVATAKPTYQKLTEISTGKKVESTDAQLGLQKAIFEKNLNEQQKIDEEAKKEIARFNASPGTAGSRSLASSNRANRRT
jgi:hypothetical protein